MNAREREGRLAPGVAGAIYSDGGTSEDPPTAPRDGQLWGVNVKRVRRERKENGRIVGGLNWSI